MATSSDLGSLSLGSQNYCAYFCQPCSRDGKQSEAERYCPDCQEFLCRECYRVHGKLTTLKQSHRVVMDRQHMKKYGPSTVDRDKSVDQCDQHRGNIIEYVCTIHKELACTMCLMLNQRTYEPDITDSQEYKDLVRTLCGMETKIADINARIQRKTAPLNDVCACSSIEEVDNLRNEAKQKMNYRIASIVKEIQMFRSELKHLETTRNFSQLSIATKTVCSVEKVRKLQTALNGLEFWNPQQIVAAYVKDVCVRSSTDCYVPVMTGITTIGDKLVICDNNCCKVRLISLKTKLVIDEMNTGEEPWDVTGVQRGQVALTIPYAKKLLFLNVTDKLSEAREMKFRNCCYGVACLDDKLALIFSNPSKVKLFDLSGTPLHEIYKDPVGHDMFGEPKYVAFGPDGHTMYLSDNQNHSVTCVTVDGTIKGVYRDKDLRGPNKLVVDSSGNIYVCGRWSQDIHVISSSLEKVKVILDMDNGISSPRALFLCPHTNNLYVGTVFGVVKVFKMS